MKKSLIASLLSIAIFPTYLYADTTLYGSIRYDYQNKKIAHYKGKTDNRYQFTGKHLSNLADSGSRIGFKGSESIGNKNSVIYNLEWGFDGMAQESSNDWKMRKAILGLTGDWGTMTAGRQDNPFKVTIVDDSIVDDFNSSDVISSAAQRAMTTTLKSQSPLSYRPELIKDFTGYQADFARVGKVIAYTTPNFAGFEMNAAIMMDSDLYPTNSRKNADLWTINAKYLLDFKSNGQLLTKLGYIQGKVAGKPKDGSNFVLNNGNNYNGRYSAQAWGIYLGYALEGFTMTVDYAKGSHKVENTSYTTGIGPKQKSKGWDIGLSYAFGPQQFTTLRATYGESELKQAEDKDKVKSWAVGFEQKLSTRTRAWVEYGTQETSFSLPEIEKKKDNILSIGMRHDF